MITLEFDDPRLGSYNMDGSIQTYPRLDISGSVFDLGSVPGIMNVGTNQFIVLRINWQPEEIQVKSGRIKSKPVESKPDASSS